ncbi:MAG TPA: hypothetical protein VM490_14620 [Armatimonadaceae bacterium]|nr:hypothetical protein [Armatimonadaceae bacterium]
MARRSGLTPINESPSLWNSITGGIRAGAWVRAASDPPLGADKAGVYAAALAAGTLRGEARRRIARALLWCDAESLQYAPPRVPWYAEAFAEYPDDERCAFFVTGLAEAGALTNPEVAAAAYAAVLRAPWLRSPWWAKLDLSRSAIARELAARYLAQPNNRDPDRVTFVGSVYDELPDGSRDRIEMARYLCRAYRAEGRTDEKALKVYALVFNQGDDAEDSENDAHLAALYLEQERYDAGASAVFGRMARQAMRAGRAVEYRLWLLRQARACIEMGRVDEGTLPVLREAADLGHDEPLYEAAYFYAVGRRRTGVLEEPEGFVERLEAAVLERERELESVYQRRGWEWGLVLRSLALAWGHRGRTDEAACALYARAAARNPEDKTLLALHARALAEVRDYGEEAMRVYERAQAQGQGNDSVLLALAWTYVKVGAAQREECRREAIALWEDLYRVGQAAPEVVEQLALAYTGDDRVNDVALSLWEKAVEADPKNGLLRLRLGREWKLRGETDAAARWYREAARLLPRDFEAQYETGLLLQEQYSDHANAARMLLKAVKLPGGGEHLGAHFALGEALLFLEKREEAKAVFQKIVDQIDHSHMPTLLHLARLNLKYEEQGILKAEELYQQARELDPEHPETYRKMAELYRERGLFEEEQVALERYLSLSEPDPERYQQLADLYVRRGDFVGAERALRQIIALGQGDKRLYILLGEVIMQAQSQAKAHGRETDEGVLAQTSPASR